MVFFNQHRVIQANAVVGAAAHFHGVFLGLTKAWQSFARVHNLRPCAFDGRHIDGSFGGDGAEELHEVERGAFTR